MNFLSSSVKLVPEMYTTYTIYNISCSVALAYTNYTSDTTRMRMLQMACENFQYYRSGK